MSREALRKLRDDERQSPVGREILQKFISGDDLRIHPASSHTPAPDHSSKQTESKND